MTAQKLFGYCLGVVLFSIPLLAAAEAIPYQPTMEQLLAREAFVKSQSDGTGVACVVKTSKSSVVANEPFMLWWGSYGGVGGGWTPTGAYTIIVQERGVYEYKLVFRAESGTFATCRTTVSVS